MRVLVVEDDNQLREQMVRQLASAGYTVDAAANGEDGLYAATEFPLDLAIIDLGLPGLGGLELIRKLRSAEKPLPVLVLTARHRWEDKVEGLEAGADDFLVKPVHPEELKARVRALIRRSGGWASSALRCGPIELDPASQTVTVDDASVELTGYEFRLLEYLILHAGNVISKSTLTEHLYPDDDDRDSNVIEVFIRRLRIKLDPTGALKPIETLRGRGYRFDLPRGASAENRVEHQRDGE